MSVNVVQHYVYFCSVDDFIFECWISAVDVFMFVLTNIQLFIVMWSSTTSYCKKKCTVMIWLVTVEQSTWMLLCQSVVTFLLYSLIYVGYSWSKCILLHPRVPTCYVCLLLLCF